MRREERNIDSDFMCPRQCLLDDNLDNAIRKIQRDLEAIQKRKVTYMEAQRIVATMIAPRIVIAPQPNRRRKKYHIETMLNLCDTK